MRIATIFDKYPYFPPVSQNKNRPFSMDGTALATIIRILICYSSFFMSHVKYRSPAVIHITNLIPPEEPVF
jgi:hypothetical protein